MGMGFWELTAVCGGCCQAGYGMTGVAEVIAAARWFQSLMVLGKKE